MKFTFFGIPVYVRMSFWLFLLIFFQSFLFHFSITGLFLQLPAMAIVFISLLLHEYGHAATARYFGASPLILLEAFGGSAEYIRRGMTNRQQFFVTLNGPLASMALIVCSALALQWIPFSPGGYFASLLLYTRNLNIIWMCVNLVPVLPLDGGRLLYYFLEKRYGARGERLSASIGLFAAAVAAYWCFSWEFFFFGVLFSLLAFQSLSLLQRRKRERKTTPPYNPFSEYIKGVEEIKNNNLDEATKILFTLLRVKDAQLRIAATESLAEAYFRQGKKKECEQLLKEIGWNGLKIGKVLLCQLAFEKGDDEMVTKHAREVYQIDSRCEVALLNARSFARKGEAKLAGAWLKTAYAFGEHSLEDFQKILRESFYDLVREDDRFQQQIREMDSEVSVHG